MSEIETTIEKQKKEAVLLLLTQMLRHFDLGGWGQAGSMTEFQDSGEFRHKVNSDTVCPLEFLGAFEPSENAEALMMHWEYFPDPETIQENPDAEPFRVLLWTDRQMHSTAIFCGRNPDEWVLAPGAFSRELDLLESLILSNGRASSRGEV